MFRIWNNMSVGRYWKSVKKNANLLWLPNFSTFKSTKANKVNLTKRDHHELRYVIRYYFRQVC